MAIRKRVAEEGAPERRDNVIDAPIAPRRITVSEALHGRRVESGLDIPHIAEVLRIRPAILTAIEEGRFDTLPGPAYAVGFIRSYATYLGLDAEALVARFKAESSAAARRPHLHFPLPVSDSRVPTLPLLLICMLLAALIYGGWYYFIAHPGDLADMIAPVPDRFHRLTAEPARPESGIAAATTGAPAPPPADQSQSQPQAQPAAVVSGPTAASPPVASPPAPPGSIAQGSTTPAPTTPAPTAPAPTAPVSGQSAVAQPPVSQSPTDGAPPVEARPAAPVASLPQTPDLAQPASRGDPAKAPVAGSYGAPVGEARVVLHANGDSWVQVRDRAGSLLFTRVLKPGESYNVPNQPGLILTAGNVGELDVTVDGGAAPRLGPAGHVVRNISLDPERLLLGPDHPSNPDHSPAVVRHANPESAPNPAPAPPVAAAPQ